MQQVTTMKHQKRNREQTTTSEELEVRLYMIVDAHETFLIESC